LKASGLKSGGKNLEPCREEERGWLAEETSEREAELTPSEG